jgi:ubiquinone/menaquinone biosynthesis C-methylase UbiE
MRQIGRDYGTAAEAEAYDARHARFRNVEKENEAILESLCIEPEHVLVEFGTGTGAFALQAAARCAAVYAVDISRAMLEFAQKKAGRAGITNILFCHGGFLTYSHAAAPVDAIVTNTAFHHLPDLWKGVALDRMNRILKPGGRLYLSDVVFEQRNLSENIHRMIEALGLAGGRDLQKDIEVHIRKEFSTYDWIMDGLLERANFEIESKNMQDGVIGRYLCRKKCE